MKLSCIRPSGGNSLSGAAKFSGAISMLEQMQLVSVGPYTLISRAPADKPRVEIAQPADRVALPAEQEFAHVRQRLRRQQAELIEDEEQGRHREHNGRGAGPRQS